ncbi:hypothetical protein ACM26V_03465 [Salipaludibacillus sp. HK11]|uniref:hypothetical protein n=1 Tax=Salipaludibacillus sp. HK11 TaxID=3394320 RepID=UPI0039FBDEDB
MLPIIIVRVLLSNNKGNVSNDLVNFCTGIVLLNFLLIKTSINFGEFSFTLFWQFLIIYPISFAAIYYLLKINKTEVTYKSLVTAFKRKQQYALGLIAMLCFSILIIGINETNHKVLDKHNQLMIDLLESENAIETLVNNSITPSTMLDILPFIHEMKDSEIEVLSLPWKSTVKVTTNKNNVEYTTKEFTYVRFYQEWQLDGIYKTSEY